MTFLSLCDASNAAELVVLDDAVAHHQGQRIAGGQVICAEGMVTQDPMRSVTLEVIKRPRA